MDPTRDTGLARLDAFAPRAGRAYTKSRNADLGPSDRSNVSVLSPYIRHRLILEEEVLRRVLAEHELPAAEKFVQEVFWRTYFKGYLEQRPGIWRRYRERVEALAGRLDRGGDLDDRYRRATNGATGIECFDAWARELIETGYLHNHTRMWFASIWVYTLELPWELGADFFYRHLMDGDPASNTLSWRWVCGLHTRGKTYLARASNIARYTNGRFDPAGQLANSAPPLTEDDPAPQIELALPNDEPDDDFGLLITEDDGNAESLLSDRPPRAALALLATAERSPLPIGERAREFAEGAIADAVARAAAHWRIDATAETGGDWGEALVAWAASHNVRTIVTAYAPVGPAAEKLALAEPALSSAGVRVVRRCRPYDALCWPHATRGYFKLKSKIPVLLGKLNLSSDRQIALL